MTAPSFICLTVNVCGRAYCFPFCGFLVFLLQIPIESFTWLYHSGFDYFLVYCDISKMR